MAFARFVITPTVASSGVPVKFKLPGISLGDLALISLMRYSRDPHSVLAFADHTAGLSTELVISGNSVDTSVANKAVIQKFSTVPSAIVEDTAGGTIDAYFSAEWQDKQPLSGKAVLLNGEMWITPFIDNAVTSGFGMSVLFSYTERGGDMLEYVQSLYS